MEKSNLSLALKKFLSLTLDIKILVITSQDGLELLLVYQGEKGDITIDDSTLTYLSSNFLTSNEQASKLGFGESSYIMSWTNHGVLVHHKLDALVITLILDEDANLGYIDNYLNKIDKILKPFSSPNFLSSSCI